MKKTLFIFITILAFLAQENIFYAQELSEIPTGPIPKITTTRSNNIDFSGISSASIAFGYSTQQDAFISIPIPAGTPFTIITPYTFTGYASSMCKGGDGNYYLIEYYSVPPVPDPSLYIFDPLANSLTLIGSITGLGPEVPNGIAYNPKDGTYYICAGDALYSFELNSRTAAYIGNFGLSGCLIIDLCFTNDGTCYGFTVPTSNAYTININNAAPTLLGPLGYFSVWPQGMSYDFETNTIYLTAYDHNTHTGQLRTMDAQTGWTTVVFDWGNKNVPPFAIDSYPGPNCPVEAPSDPDPANGSTDVTIDDAILSWTNGTGTTSVEVWFGEAGSVVKVYDGVEISTWALDTLSYSTTYNWRVICKNDTCTTAGPYWTFLTQSDTTIIFYEPFNNLNCWTPIGPQGFDNWIISNTNNAGGSPSSELRFVGWEPIFDGNSRLLSCPINDDSYHYIIKLKHMVEIYGVIGWGWVGLSVTYDGGNTGQLIWQCPIEVNIGPEEIQTELYPESYPFQMILIFDGFSYTLDGWYVDDLQLIDDCMECFPPASPSNLGSQHYYNPHRVLLYWLDNSWNEEGFHILRKNGFPNDTTQYQLIGTVAQNHRNFWDQNILVDSTYTYRVMAFNQYGNSDTSNTTTITIPIPVELISFTADLNKGNVILNWSTATELNNLGFEVERKTTDEYYTIGFVEGNGSTTEIHNYSYADAFAERGLNYYRLKQIDFSGKFAYSEELEVDFNILHFFSLEQNYPNPFNPKTIIEFNLVVDSKVSLKIFDLLGQEVNQLLNSNLLAGNHKIDFNASLLNSGIYFYKLEVLGIDGTNFSDVKKMILAK